MTTNEIPVYVEQLLNQLKVSLRYATPEEVQQVRNFLIDCAKQLIDVEISGHLQIQVRSQKIGLDQLFEEEPMKSALKRFNYELKR